MEVHSGQSGHGMRFSEETAVFQITLALSVCFLAPGLATARTWHVPTEAPTIQAGIDSATAGDDVLVAPGRYFEHDIVMKSGVLVHSEQGPEGTIVDAGEVGVGFVVDSQSTTILEGFSILNGRADGEFLQSGGGIACVGSRLSVRRCIITDCRADLGVGGGGVFAYESELEAEACFIGGCYAYGGGGAICAYNSSATIVDCETSGNGAGTAGGIYALGPHVAMTRSVVSGNWADWGSAGGVLCASPDLRIAECLIENSREFVTGGPSALHIISSVGGIYNCTVAGNEGFFQGDPAVGVQDSAIGIERTIIAFNEGRGLDCSWGVESQVTVQCSDCYGNRDGNEICGEDLGGNFSADPLFCDAGNGDYSLDAESPCLPGNHPDGADCGQIGARGQGCGATSVGEMSWGRLKSLYRGQ